MNSNYLDIISRTQLNDTLSNLFYFFWTQFFYLPFFVLLVLYFICIINLSRLDTFFFIKLFCTLYLYYYAISSYAHFNVQNYEIINISFYNLLLSNPINKYHPYLFYTSAIFILVLLVQTYKLKYLFYTNMRYKSVLNWRITINLILTITLYLGSWWAVQEGSWGGWWNWDSSEVFGLIILIISFLYLHIFFNKNVLSTQYYNLLYFYIIVFVYTFTQLNFDLISHNFGIREHSLLNFNNYLPLTIIFVLLFFKLLFSNSSLVLTNIIILHKYQITQYTYNYSYRYYIFLFIVYFSILVCIPSFYPLLNNLIWKTLNINLFNTLYVEKTVLNLLYTTILIFLFKISFKIFNLFASLPNFLLPLTFFLNVKPKWVFLWHILVFIFLLTTFFYHSSTHLLLNVGLGNYYQNVILTSSTKYNITFVDYSFLTDTSAQIFNKKVDFLTYKITSGISNPLQSFLNPNSLYNISQILTSGTLFYPFAIHILDISSNQVNLNFILLVYISLRYTLSKIKIIF